MSPRSPAGSISFVALALLLAPPARAAAQATDRAVVAPAVDSIVASVLKDGRTAGMSVAVVRGPDTLVLKGYGKADLELDVPTPPDAVYEIGSVTKQFTAAAILQLMEQGKLSLDDDLAKYVPAFARAAQRVTLRQLLGHTSGVYEYTRLPFAFNPAVPAPPSYDSLAAILAGMPFDFPPGTQMIYDNSGFYLLGMVVEKVSGVPYWQYIAEHVFQPAGMTHSRYCDNETVVKNRAHGYRLAGSAGLQLAPYIDMRWPYAAGALCSTPGDLVAWERALHGGRVLGAAGYRALLTTGALADGTRTRYASGLGVDSAFGRRRIWHGGTIPGFRTELEYFPDDGVTIAVLVNTLGPVSPHAVARSIGEVLFGKPPALKAAPYRGKVADLVGDYAGPGRGGEMTVSVARDSTGALTARLPESTPGKLEYLAGETFTTAGGGVRLSFRREQGVVRAVVVDNVIGCAVLRRKAGATP